MCYISLVLNVYPTCRDIPMLNAVTLHCISMQHWTLPDSEIGHVTAEKQTPSAIDFLANVRSAIDMERRLATSKGGTGSSRALKDVLGKVVSDYNKLVTVKKHRIDSAKRSLCYNMLLVRSQPSTVFCFSNLCFRTRLEVRKLSNNLWNLVNQLRLRAPQEFHEIIHSHYDRYRHESSGGASGMCWMSWTVEFDLTRYPSWHPSTWPLGSWIYFESWSWKVSKQAVVQRNSYHECQHLHPLCQTCHGGHFMLQYLMISHGNQWQIEFIVIVSFAQHNSLWGLREKGFQGCIV